MKPTVPDWAKKKVEYKWDIEKWAIEEISTDPDSDDIIDHDYQPTLRAFGVAPVIDGKRHKLVLIREVYTECNGVQKLEWAYAVRTDGRWTLPPLFDEGTAVPKRFHEELLRSGF